MAQWGTPHTQMGENHINIAGTMLYIGWMVIVSGHDIRNIHFLDSSIFELSKAKNHLSKMCASPLGTPRRALKEGEKNKYTA